MYWQKMMDVPVAGCTSSFSVTCEFTIVEEAVLIIVASGTMEVISISFSVTLPDLIS